MNDNEAVRPEDDPTITFALLHDSLLSIYEKADDPIAVRRLVAEALETIDEAGGT